MIAERRRDFRGGPPIIFYDQHSGHAYPIFGRSYR
jgi:hypothetical protein